MIKHKLKMRKASWQFMKKTGENSAIYLHFPMQPRQMGVKSMLGYWFDFVTSLFT